LGKWSKGDSGRIKNMNERTFIPVITLSELSLSEHFREEPYFEQENIERCPECGSSLFRIYKEPVLEGLYEQNICAICNHRVGGWLNDFIKKKVKR
jgi:uncharacterized protein with PIN domain